MVEIQEEYKTFLSIKKCAVYLLLTLFGIICKILNWPGNIFILFGLGLFYGHIIYRTIKYKGKIVLKSITLLIATALISIIILLKFKPTVATSIIIYFAFVAILIDWKEKKFIILRIAIFVILLLTGLAAFYYLNDNDDSENNNTSEKNHSKEQALIYPVVSDIANTGFARIHELI